MAVAAKKTHLTGLPRRLVQEEICTEEVVQQAIAAAKKEKTTLVNHLINNRLADAQDVAQAACHEFGVPTLNLEALAVDIEVCKLVNQDLLAKHKVLPLVKRGKRIFIAVSDPTNLHALDEIRFQTALSVEAVVVEQDKLDEAIDKAMEAMDTSMDAYDEDDFDLENLEIGAAEDFQPDEVSSAEIDDAPVVRFVNKILLDAIRKGASDVHFEPFEKFFRVRVRQDGVLREVAKPPVALAGKVCARLKVMSRLDIAERRVPQDGRIKMRISKNRSIDFRMNTCPTLFGEKVVLRILDPTSAQMGIENLGYEDFQRILYEKQLAKPYGMILVTGPTGSGKTVSLYTGLNILNSIDRNISTAEDPVEINMPGVNQVNVNYKVGLNFATAMKAFLRQDPDVIMVGEIRDLETADIAIKAAQTGHLVLSTLHTNDAPNTLTRMVDMGVKPYAIASSISLIIAQRLARRLCNDCKEIRDIPPEALLKEGFTREDIKKGLTIYGPVGCSRCTDGYKGRTGIYQVMPVTHEIGQIILQGGNATQVADQAALEGVWDLRRSALEKARQGITGLEEINRITID
ncbi:MAG: type IV-A pilus assembly ATPase PilB [Gammaproteobacteria bacterium]|nr:type IV-A pilus assembly ATPase PilB [Gammaproteobacteria bacterium]